GGWPVAPGSESSHDARHGLARRAFIGGPAAAAAGPSLGSGVLWPVAASAWSAENARGFSLESDPSRDDERLRPAEPREEWDFLPLKMVMQSSLHAARPTAVKGEEQGVRDETKSSHGCHFGWPQPAGSGDISDAARGTHSHECGHLSVRGHGRNQRQAWWRRAVVLHHLWRRHGLAEWCGNLRHHRKGSQSYHPRYRADTRGRLRFAGALAARNAVQHVRVPVRRPAAGDHRPGDRARAPVWRARPRARGHGHGLRPRRDSLRGWGL